MKNFGRFFIRSPYALSILLIVSIGCLQQKQPEGGEGTQARKILNGNKTKDRRFGFIYRKEGSTYTNYCSMVTLCRKGNTIVGLSAQHCDIKAGQRYSTDHFLVQKERPERRAQIVAVENVKVPHAYISKGDGFSVVKAIIEATPSGGASDFPFLNRFTGIKLPIKTTLSFYGHGRNPKGTSRTRRTGTMQISKYGTHEETFVMHPLAGHSPQMTCKGDSGGPGIYVDPITGEQSIAATVSGGTVPGKNSDERKNNIRNCKYSDDRPMNLYPFRSKVIEKANNFIANCIDESPSKFANQIELIVNGPGKAKVTVEKISESTECEPSEMGGSCQTSLQAIQTFKNHVYIELESHPLAQLRNVKAKFVDTHGTHSFDKYLSGGSNGNLSFRNVLLNSSGKLILTVKFVPKSGYLVKKLDLTCNLLNGPKNQFKAKVSVGRLPDNYEQMGIESELKEADLRCHPNTTPGQKQSINLGLVPETDMFYVSVHEVPDTIILKETKFLPSFSNWESMSDNEWQLIQPMDGTDSVNVVFENKNPVDTKRFATSYIHMFLSSGTEVFADGVQVTDQLQEIRIQGKVAYRYITPMLSKTEKKWIEVIAKKHGQQKRLATYILGGMAYPGNHSGYDMIISDPSENFDTAWIHVKLTPGSQLTVNGNPVSTKVVKDKPYRRYETQPIDKNTYIPMHLEATLDGKTKQKSITVKGGKAYGIFDLTLPKPEKGISYIHVKITPGSEFLVNGQPKELKPVPGKNFMRYVTPALSKTEATHLRLDAMLEGHTKSISIDVLGGYQYPSLSTSYDLTIHLPPDTTGNCDIAVNPRNLYTPNGNVQVFKGANGLKVYRDGTYYWYTSDSRTIHRIRFNGDGSLSAAIDPPKARSLDELGSFLKHIDSLGEHSGDRLRTLTESQRRFIERHCAEFTSYGNPDDSSSEEEMDDIGSDTSVY